MSRCSESGLALLQRAHPFLSVDGVHCWEGHMDSMTTPSCCPQSLSTGTPLFVLANTAVMLTESHYCQKQLLGASKKEIAFHFKVHVRI